MSVTARLLHPGEVAVLLGMKSARSFLARYKRLLSHQFPKSIPACGRRWDRKAVEAWLDNQQRKFGASQADLSDAEDVLIGRARDLTDAR